MAFVTIGYTVVIVSVTPGFVPVCRITHRKMEILPKEYLQDLRHSFSSTHVGPIHILVISSIS